jgi:outer membrane protein OmpA-like peptidoglycan-associated protein
LELLRMRPVIASGLLLICVATYPVSALAACSAELADIEVAARSAPWQDTDALVQKVEYSITCEPWEQFKAKALLSSQLLAEARKIDPKLKDPAAIALVEKAATLAADWRALELKGRIHRAANKFESATGAFQMAINLIADWDNKKSEAPAGASKNDATKAERANLVAEADEAKHLAASGQGVLVLASTDRAGNPGGVLSAAMQRGAVGVRVPAPILFEFNSAQFTKIGTDAAQEIVAFLKKRGPASITVTGHTDRVGTETYNIDLSKRRAATVAAFLKDNGIGAKIVTVGKGFSEPWKLSDSASYTQAQIDELNRRVEFDWN